MCRFVYCTLMFRSLFNFGASRLEGYPAWNWCVCGLEARLDELRVSNFFTVARVVFLLYKGKGLYSHLFLTAIENVG